VGPNGVVTLSRASNLGCTLSFPPARAVFTGADRLPQSVGDLGGSPLSVRVDDVDVIEVAQGVRYALLDTGQVGVVAEVAATVGPEVPKLRRGAR
jgi:hypothetical protein